MPVKWEDDKGMEEAERLCRGVGIQERLSIVMHQVGSGRPECQSLDAGGLVAAVSVKCR